MKQSGYLLLLSVMSAAGAPGCRPVAQDDPDALMVFVAASLSDPITELAQRFARAQGVAVYVSAGASGALRKQIELGAPCDVFVSADADQIDALDRAGWVRAGTRRVVARNRLVIAYRPGLNVSETGPTGLTSDTVRRVAVANSDYAPAGRYARQALIRAGVWRALQPKIVVADDVRTAAFHVAQGTVDAAIIYATDAEALEVTSEVFVFPPSSHDAIEYVGAVIRSIDAGHVSGGGDRNENALSLAFAESLTDDSANDVWQQHGFLASIDGGARSATATDDGDGDTNSGESCWSAIALSIRVSLVATGLCLLPGVWLGAWLARTRSRLRTFVEVAVVAPLVVPPVVTGLLLLVALRAIFRDLLFTWWAAALASAIVAVPLLIRTVRSTVEQTDARYGVIAATLGASRRRILWTITLPLAWRGIVAGATLAWARALGEFGATVVVAGNISGRTRTLPLAIWTNIQTPGATASAVPLVIASVLLAVSAVAIGEWLIRHDAPEAQRA